MIKSPVTSPPGASNWGSFALVTYLPDPLGSFLTQLRRYEPGGCQPEAHITFLPPRPLTMPLEAAAREIGQVLGDAVPFELGLGAVNSFPETNMIYLTIEDGFQAVLNLHAALNKGKLFAHEQFAFVPHLTLSGELHANELEPALERAARAWHTYRSARRFTVNDVVLLWQAGVHSDKNWTRISAFPLFETVSSAPPVAEISA